MNVRTAAAVSTAGQLEYALATRDDAEACNELHRALSGRNRTTSEWLWEFAQQPDGDERIPYAVARADGRIVGTQGLLLVPFITAAGPVLTAKGEDTVVDPGFWDRDALSGLWATLTDYCRSRQIPFAWGFNGRKGSFKRVGFAYASDEGAEFLLKPLTPASIRIVLEGTRHARRRLDGPGGPAAAWLAGAVLASASRMRETVAALSPVRDAAIRIMPAPADGTGLEHLPARLVARYGGVAIDRTPRFVRHRLLNNPFLRSTLLCASTTAGVEGFIGYAVDADAQAYVTDFVVAPADRSAVTEPAVAGALLDAVIGSTRSQGAAILRLTSFNRHPAARVMLEAAGRHGFFRRPTSSGACIKAILGGDSAGTFSAYQEWFVTGLNTEGRQG